MSYPAPQNVARICDRCGVPFLTVLPDVHTCRNCLAPFDHVGNYSLSAAMEHINEAKDDE